MDIWTRMASQPSHTQERRLVVRGNELREAGPALPTLPRKLPLEALARLRAIAATQPH